MNKCERKKMHEALNTRSWRKDNLLLVSALSIPKEGTDEDKRQN